MIFPFTAYSSQIAICRETFGCYIIPPLETYAEDIQSITASQLLLKGRDNSVSIATRYGQNSPGIGSRDIFHPPPDQPWDPPSLIYNGYRVIPRGKPYGAWR